MRIAAPGTQVSSGRLRVDAARAIRKLREYQLADRAAWVLEGIRAAVASGATAVELRGDANDIWLSWHGTPWEPELLPRLFDELVSPEATDERQHVRLLAAAINTALGMDPIYVDVYSITAAGQARRARYTPEVLAEPENELGEAALHHVEVVEATPPTAVMSGMLVHLRRRASLDVLAYWLGQPPELPIARASCRDLPVPLTVNDEPPLHRMLHTDVVRVPLDEGLSGFVAIGPEPTGAHVAGCLEVAERGVVLVRYPFDVLGHGPQMPVPVRVFVDADRLPTNVSRSQVRRDIHPIATAERRAKQVIGRAIGDLARLVTDSSADIAQRARRVAVWLLASAIGGHPEGWNPVPEVLAPLADLPLVRNAYGVPRTVRQKFATFIHTEKTALDADLQGWLGEVLWIPPGDPSSPLLGSMRVDAAVTRRRVRWARQQRRAQKKFLAHEKRALTVSTASPPRIRVALGVPVEGSCVPQGVFDGVTGELCVYDDSTNAALVLCVDERELERIELTTSIGFDAVIDCKQLQPDDRYRGVRRDDAFEHVLRALRAGVVRAVEQVAAQRVVGGGDRVLVRRALVLAHTLELALSGPLVTAPAWTTVRGEAISHAQLVAGGHFGVVGELDEIEPPHGRTIVRAGEGELELLRQLFGKRVIRYHRVLGAPALDLERLAATVGHFDRAACLTFSTPGYSGVIALSGKPTLHLHHRGVALAELPYPSVLVSCSIALDSDAIVPNDRWNGIVDAAGFEGAAFRELEVSLVRAIVQTWIGQRPPTLVSPQRIAVLDDPNILALSKVFTGTDLAEILGRDLHAALLGAPLVLEHGSDVPISIAELAARQPQGIHYVTGRVDHVDDFRPIVATPRGAQIIGAIARLPVYEGSSELERRRRLSNGRQRHARHLEQPEQGVTVGGTFPQVALVSSRHGRVTVTSSQPAIHVFVDKRPWLVLRPELGLPVAAAVELPRTECGDAFDSLPNLTIEELLDDVRATVPRLVAELANHASRLLGAPGPARRLLASCLQGKRLDRETVDLLRSVPAFETVQGEHVSIARAEDEGVRLSVAAYSDEWLAAGDGEAATSLDSPILRVARPPDELTTIIGALHLGAVTDATKDVQRLQARRRMARGLIPTPKLPAIPAALKRPLPAFGELTRELGHGEIGFPPDGGPSRLVIFEGGQQSRTLEIDVLPAVHLAVESPQEVLDHDRMRGLAQTLAVELVRTVIAPLGDAAPPPVRASVGHAVLARRVPPVLVGRLSMFECLDGTWLDWKGFEAQQEKFGQVWAVITSPRNRQPLDPDRAVLVLELSTLTLATTAGQPIINASIELELDLTARTNMERPDVAELRLPGYDGVLTAVELEGDGVKSPRGTVAVLGPASSGRRGLHPHRALHPFDPQEDPCRWPTLAVIDDARITPDRTWSAPKADGVWQSIVKEVRAASERALELVGEVPSSALAHVRVTSELCSGITELRTAPRSQLRGVLWLSELPHTEVSIVLRGDHGVRSFAAPSGLALGGSLAVYRQDDLVLGAALEQLCLLAYARLVRTLARDEAADPGFVAAHVAHALALGAVKPTEISGLKFSCFAPRPLEARGLVALFERKTSIPYVTSLDTDLKEPAFYDDGSEVAKIVRGHLGERLLRHTSRSSPPSRPSAPARPPVSTQRPAPSQPPRPAPKREPHVLEPLVELLARRIAHLGIPAQNMTITDRSEPMLLCEAGGLHVAGKNARLLALATGLSTKSPFVHAAIDAVAAHAVSLLNIAHTEITDAAEQSALAVLLANPLSAGPPRSRRSS